MTRRQAGFTMTELMVVVAILGIVAALSLTALKTDAVGSDARKISALVAAARRVAIAGGPVRTDVVAATGVRARAQLTIEADAGAFGMRVWKLVERPSTPEYDWVEVTGQYTDRNTLIQAVTAAATSTPGVTSPSPLLGSTRAERSFYPDGTCDAFTAYLEKLSGGSRWRVFAMPMTGAATAYQDW